MRDKAVVCFIFPGIAKSAEDPSQIINRLNSYVSKFAEQTKDQNSKAILISSGFPARNGEKPDSDTGLYTHILSAQKVNSLKYLVKSYSILRSELGNKITLVAGDNYQALLLCLLLRKMLRENIKVQISIHGNPFSRNLLSLKYLLRKLIFRFLVPQASSIRVVSSHLKEELGNYFNKKAEIIICPIPISLPPLTYSRQKNRTVGVVGRLHRERGIGLLCEIFTTFAKSKSDVKFIVIGDGPERRDIEIIAQRFNDFSLSLLGSISHDQVLENYSNIELLLSCAPSEGYGLALREALLSGLPVIAKENNGTRELMALFPEMVFLFNSMTEAVKLINSQLGLRADPEIVENYRRRQLDLDESSITALLKSWS